ncbi:MAG: hypothetical protein HYV63_23995 [Candidatus Schekmanbacteria bacterium]|nr:hypothetical protein [Candidatus Schekmanbacteria bacterium]
MRMQRLVLVLAGLFGIATTMPAEVAWAQATYTWVGASGSWSTPGNWSPSGPPTSGADVIIDAASYLRSVVVTLDQDATVDNLTLTSDATYSAELSLSGSKTFTVNGASTVDSFSTLTLQNGVLAGIGGLVIDGTFNWSGGTIEGTGALTVNSGAVVSGGNWKTLDTRVLTTVGGTWSGTGTLWFENEAQLVNELGAAFTITSDAAADYSTGGTIVNNGTITKSAGSGGQTTIDVPFENNGILNVAEGIVSLTRGGTGTSCTYAVTAGAELQLDGYTQAMDTASFAGDGRVTLMNGTMTVAGTGASQTDATTELAIEAGTLNGTADFTANGPFFWTGGTISGSGTFDANSTVLIDPSSWVTLDNRNFTASGALQWSAVGSIYVSGGATWTHEATATFDIQGDEWFQNTSGGGTFVNAGTVTKSAGLGTAGFEIPVNNTGTIQVDAGTLAFLGGGQTDATMNAAVGAALQFGGGTFSLDGAFFGGGGTVDLSAGTLDDTGLSASTFDAGVTLTLSGGTLSGDQPTTVAGTAEWRLGTISGAATSSAALTIEGLLTISTASWVYLDTRMLKAMTVAHTGSGDLYLKNDAVFELQVAGTYDLQTDAGILYGSPGGRFANYGTFTKSGGSVSSQITNAFDNDGTVNAGSGTLSFESGGTHSGVFSTVASAAIELAGGVHTLSAVSFTGAGSVRVSAGEVTVGGSSKTTVASTTSFEVTGGGTLGGAQQMEVNGPFGFSYGTLNGAGTLTLAGASAFTSGNAKTVDGKPIVNNSLLTWSGTGWLVLKNGASITNLTSGVIDIQTDETIDDSFPGGGTIANYGLIRKSAGLSVAYIESPLDNAGTIAAESGAIWLGGNGTHTGEFQALPAAEVTFGAGQHQLTGASFTMGGTARLASGAFTITGADATSVAAGTTLAVDGGTLSGTGPMSVAGMLIWSGGTLGGSGAFDIGGSLVVSGGGTKRLDGKTLTLSGTGSWTGSGWWELINAAVVNIASGATFDIATDSTLDALIPDGGTLTNAGTLTKSAGSGTSATTLFVGLVNTGAVSLDAGVLEVSSYVQTAGQTTLGGGALVTTGTIDLQGGFLYGSGTITGNVSNSGAVVAPGNPTGALAIDGDFTQAAAGQIIVDVGGTTAGTTYDQITVTGAAALSGTLQSSLINAFVPTLGQTFRAMTFASVAGEFTSYVGASASGIMLTPVLTATALDLQAELDTSSAFMPDVRQFAATPQDGQVVLTWVPVPAVDAPSGTLPTVTVVRKEASYPISLSDGVIVAAGANPPLVDAGATNGTTYYYAAFVETASTVARAAVLASPGVFSRATPLAGLVDLTPPVFVDGGPLVVGKDADLLSVSWAVNEPAAVEVFVNTGDGYTSVADTYYAVQRTISLTGLGGAATGVFLCATDLAQLGPVCTNELPIGLPGAADTTNPVLLQAPTVHAYEDRAIIEVVTDDPSAVTIELGLTTSYGRQVMDTAVLAPQHRVEIAGLQEGTAYHYRVQAQNASALTTTSADFTFHTCVGCGHPEPVVTSASCDTGTAGLSEVLLTVTTNLPTQLELSWGISGGAQSENIVGLAFEYVHSLMIPGLTAGQAIDYTVRVSDRFANSSALITGSCSTAAAAPAAESALRITSGPLADVSRIGTTFGTIDWTTDVMARSRLVSVTPAARTKALGLGDGAPASARAAAVAADWSAYRTEHAISVANLLPATTYDVVVESVDIFARGVTAETLTFTTQDTQEDLPPTFQAAPSVPYATQNTVLCDWTVSEATQAIATLEGTPLGGRAPVSFSWSSPAPAQDHQAVFGNVPAGTYTYRVSAVTASGQSLSSSTGDLDFSGGDSADNTAPGISSVAVAEVTDSLALLRWITDEPTRSAVRYGTSLPLKGRKDDNAYVTGHLVQLTGLTPGQRILYQIEAYDVAGNKAEHGPENIQMQETKDTTAPLIDGGSLRLTWLSNSSALIEWDTDEAADSTVEFGGSTEYRLLVQNPKFVTQHAILLDGLLGGKRYYARVRSLDMERNKSDYETFDDPFVAPVPVSGAPALAAMAALLAPVLVFRSTAKRMARPPVPKR